MRNISRFNALDDVLKHRKTYLLAALRGNKIKGLMVVLKQKKTIA